MKSYQKPTIELLNVKYERGVCDTPGVVSFRENKTPVEDEEEEIGGAAIFRPGIWDEE